MNTTLACFPRTPNGARGSCSATIAEYERLLGLHEDIVRFLTIKIEKVDETPSPLMNNKVDRNKNEATYDNTKTASKANV